MLARGTTGQRHYLSAEGVLVGVVASAGELPVLAAGAVSPVPVALVANKLQFWHLDHLGSVVATTDANAAVTARYAWDPYGKRRNLSGSEDSANPRKADWSAAVNGGTDRGFTGHEQLDDIGIVHLRIRERLVALEAASVNCRQPQFDAAGRCG